MMIQRSKHPVNCLHGIKIIGSSIDVLKYRNTTTRKSQIIEMTTTRCDYSLLFASIDSYPYKKKWSLFLKKWMQVQLTGVRCNFESQDSKLYRIWGRYYIYTIRYSTSWMMKFEWSLIHMDMVIEHKWTKNTCFVPSDEWLEIFDLCPYSLTKSNCLFFFQDLGTNVWTFYGLKQD